LPLIVKNVKLAGSVNNGRVSVPVRIKIRPGEGFQTTERSDA